MALTTLNEVIAGLRTPTYTFKSPSNAADGRYLTTWYVGPIPVNANVNTAGTSGAALTYPVQGSIPWTPPGSGDTVLARYVQRIPTGLRSSLLIDRLWHNSGLNATLTTAQNVNSATLPARDINQTTNGEGVLIGLELSTAASANTPTVTISYTNSAGTSGRTATNINALAATSGLGNFYIFSLQAGDTGVSSIQTITYSIGWTQAVAHLVLFRVIAHLPVNAIGGGAASLQVSSTVEDVIGLAAPKIFEGSVLQVLGQAHNGNAPTVVLTLTLSSG